MSFPRNAGYLARRAAQQERAPILHRRALKDPINWAVHRRLFCQDADGLMKKFDANKPVAQELLSNVATLENIVSRLEEEIVSLNFQLIQERNERRIAEYRINQLPSQPRVACSTANADGLRKTFDANKPVEHGLSLLRQLRRERMERMEKMRMEWEKNHREWEAEVDAGKYELEPVGANNNSDLIKVGILISIITSGFVISALRE